MTRHREQQGVALIFALGILSLILVMGMAFLGNALIGQKIAFNSRETASARLTARSALDRAMSQLVLFNLTQCGQVASSYLSPEVSSVFSRIDGGGTVLENEQGDTKDQLAGNDSKLNVGPSEMRLYSGKDSRARWIYVHRNGGETDGLKTDQTANPIIARYAYQVLPPIARNSGTFSRNSLSLYAVTSGADGVAGVNSGTANRKAQSHRWGIDVDELSVPEGLAANMFAHWIGSSPWSPQHEFDNFQNLLSGTGQPFYWSKTDAAAKKEVESRKKWLRYFFTEGRGRTAREAYSDGAGVWYTRFNLSDGTPFYDDNEDSKGNWYSRLLTKKPASAAAEANEINGGGSVTVPLKNSETAVNNLARIPDPFEDGFYYDKDGIDVDKEFSLGIPFLKRIGSNTEKGGFDAVENLRKQIAANLNDYCDSDSIPTSNIPASTWKNLCVETDGTKLPAYTGNEKTLYINELAFGFRMTEAKFAPGAKYEFKAMVEPEVIAELINVYKAASANPAANCKLRGAVRYLSLTLKVSVKGSVTVRWKKSGGEYGDDIHYDISEYKFEEKEVPVIDPGAGTPTPFIIEGFTGAGPYWVKNYQFPAPAADNIPVDLTERLREAAGSLLDGKNVESFNMSLTGVKVELTKVTFDFGHWVLTSPDDDGEEIGRDFVKSASPTGTLKGYALSLSSPPATPTPLFGEELTSAGELATRTSGNKCIFHLGSVQAFDPRQNLNLNFEQTRQNDWFRAKDPSILVVEEKSAWLWSNFASRVTGGKVNDFSNPKEPKYHDGGERVGDTEGTIDPAWQGEGFDEHISTAVIRNKPMRSPWELGFIHRGIPFQTINLKKAGGFDGSADLANDAHKPGNFTNPGGDPWALETGTGYATGDAGILDEIKMTEYNKSFGKIDVSSLISAKPGWWVGATETDFGNYNLALYKALFVNLRVGQKAEEFLTESDNLSTVPAALTGTVLTKDSASVPASLPGASCTSVQLRSKFLNGQSTTFKTEEDTDDARQEELIGKTVNLIDANSCSPGNVYKIVIVAQTIRDMDGAGTLGKFDVTFPDSSDPEKNVYTDEILGECRMLATVEKVTYLEGTDKVPRVRLRILQIEYLD